jgi:flagellar motility protein MotE (MotC chaperone)
MSDDVEELDETAESDATATAVAKKSAKKAKPDAAKKAKSAKAGSKGKGKTKGFNWVLVLAPVAVIAAAVFVFAFPPTHAMLAKGPLKGVLARFDHPTKGGKKQDDDPAADAKRLAAQVDTERKNAAAKDAQIAQLQAQVSSLSPQPNATETPAPKPTAPVISDDMKRAATYWAGMDADKAAAIVKQLPESYVKLVFSQMPPDAVSDIMSELPPKAAARLIAGDQSPTP